MSSLKKSLYQYLFRRTLYIAKSLIKRRRKLKAICPRCKSPDYKIDRAPDGRPSFICVSCNEYWTCGYNGGKYMIDQPKDECCRQLDLVKEEF